ncbi:MAG: hypothetical protein H6673_02200 [Anaerolineales bacterium]|nr:hypothetical protein [Anaerolineales bacterium]
MQTRNFTVLAVITMLLYASLWTSAPYSSPDTLDYQATADDLRDGTLDVLPLRPIGYSVFLLFSGSGRWLYYTQMALYLLSIFLLVKLVCPQYQLVFILIAILPPFFEPTAHILTETLTQFMLVVGVLSLYRWYQEKTVSVLLLGSVAICLSGLIRPTYQLLLPALALAVLWLTHQWKPVLLMLTVTVVMIGSYSLYNFRQFHYFGTSPLLGMSLSTKTPRVLERLPDEYAVERDLLLRYRDASLLAPDNPNMPGTVHTGKWYIWDALPEYQAVTGQSTAEASAHLLKLNLYLIQQEPLEYFVEVGEAAALFWMPVSNFANFDSRIFYLLWAIAHFAFIGSFFVVLHRRPATDFLSRIMLVTIAYTWVISSTIAIGEPRYRQPVELFILLILLNQISPKIEPKVVS